MRDERTITVEFTVEEAEGMLDRLKQWSSERVIMSAGAKLLVAIAEERRRQEPPCPSCGEPTLEHEGRRFCDCGWSEGSP